MIGDRPDEVLATLGGRDAAACWDTGHYLQGVKRLGLPRRPSPDFIRAVTHMHVHDVIDGSDHWPPTKKSNMVAEYVALAASGSPSITLEYDYLRACDSCDPGLKTLLAHLEGTKNLLREWAKREVCVTGFDASAGAKESGAL